MSRYVPTSIERDAIDLLTVAGYKVVRARTYDGLLERVRRAEAMQQYEREQRDHSRLWAVDCLAEERS
jgi:hypothetical protein